MSLTSRLVPVALVLVLASRPAVASSPNSIFTVPHVVEILPDDATGTRVVIGGAFFFLATPLSFSYGEPMCGYMTFQCKPGQEAMCRMQWLDLRKAIGSMFCSGFGPMDVVSTAKVRPDRLSLGTPDTWDLGYGVTMGASVDGKCPKARMLNCAAPGTPPDASAPVVIDAAAPAVVDAAVTVPPPDAGSAPPVTPDAAIAPVTPDATVLAADAAPAPTLAKSDGCAVGGSGSGAFPLGALLLLALALGRSVRRR